MKLVSVEWEDSSNSSCWQRVEDVKLGKAVQCVSVGFLLGDENNVITLTANLGDVGTDNEQCCGIISIPVKCINKIETIKESE